MAIYILPRQKGHNHIIKQEICAKTRLIKLEVFRLSFAQSHSHYIILVDKSNLII